MHLVEDGQMTSQSKWHRILRDFSVNPIDDNKRNISFELIEIVQFSVERILSI